MANSQFQNFAEPHQAPQNILGTIGDIERAINTIAPRWSRVTFSFHGLEHARDAISFEENLLYALLLMRTHRFKEVLRARDLIHRLLCFQIPLGPGVGLFPRQLHRFPHPGPPRWQQWVAGLLTLICKTQAVPCGKRLQRGIDAALQRLFSALSPCIKEEDQFENFIFGLASQYHLRDEMSTFAEMGNRPDLDSTLDWSWGPEKLAVGSIFQAELGNSESWGRSGHLRCWHPHTKSWLGLLKRTHKGCLWPFDPISRVFGGALMIEKIPQAQHRQCLLRGLLPNDQSSSFRPLSQQLAKSLFSDGFGKNAQLGKGAISLSAPKWAGMCLQSPLQNGIELTRHWDLARFIWGEAQRPGCCRLQIDAEHWLLTPQIESDALSARLTLKFSVSSMAAPNISPLNLLCSKERGDGWKIARQRSSIFHQGDRVDYSDDRVHLSLTIASSAPLGEWIGHIKPAHCDEGHLAIDHWHLFLKPLRNLFDWKINLIFEISILKQND